MQLKFVIIFASLNCLALLSLCVYKFVNQPVKVVHERTSIMNREEKSEIIKSVLQELKLSTNNISSAASSDLNLPRPVRGYIYLSENKFYYRSPSDHDFSEGSLFPFDCSRIVMIDWDVVQTEKGFYIVQPVQSSYSPVVPSPSVQSSTALSPSSFFGG